MSNIKQPSPEVCAAMRALVYASAKFTDAALEQFKTESPSEYQDLDRTVGNGLAQMVLTLSLDPGSYVAQLCADVGAKRQVIATVPMKAQTSH